jgi:phage-related baseplate assembly protein
VTVSITASITSDGSLAPETIIFNTQQALTNYINALLIGQSCIRNKLIAAIMGVPGVSNVSVTVPSGDTTISGNQVARIGTMTLTVV